MEQVSLGEEDSTRRESKCRGPAAGVCQGVSGRLSRIVWLNWRAQNEEFRV
jgi:hypothetical protein